MLVDNSIVVLENIYRLYREGKDPKAIPRRRQPSRAAITRPL